MATKSKKSAAPVSETKFKTTKQWKDGGVRELVTKAAGKGSTAAQVAAAVSKTKKGYTPATALNCLRWLATEGYVARLDK